MTFLLVCYPISFLLFLSLMVENRIVFETGERSFDRESHRVCRKIVWFVFDTVRGPRIATDTERTV